MSKRHPQNGPSLSDATIKKSRPNPPSPDRQQAALQQAMRDADKEKRFRQGLKEDPVGLIEEHLGSIADYLKNR
jgi:hypothetical protein